MFFACHVIPGAAHLALFPAYVVLIVDTVA
jgi:hypothetical protein